jgi:hypothetical protein
MHTRPRLDPDTPHLVLSLSMPRSSSRAEQSRLSSKKPSTVQPQPHPHPLALQVVPRSRMRPQMQPNLHLTSDHPTWASMHDTRTCMQQHGADCGHVELGRGKTTWRRCAHRLPWARALMRLERLRLWPRVCIVGLAEFRRWAGQMASPDRIRRGEMR